MKHLRLAFLACLFSLTASAAPITITEQPGYRLIDGSDINTIITAVNGLAAGTTTGIYTGTFDGTVGGTTPAAGAFTTVSATGVVSLADGLVGTPSLSFTSDADTGLYRVGANSFALVANGVAQATITTGGINGILGGTTPAAVSATSITSSTYIDQSMGNALSAAGTTRADATQLAKQINQVTTAAAGTGVILPASATAGIGAVVIVFNAGANALQVYGSGSDTIDGVAGSTGVPLTNAKRCIYILVAANTWISAQLGVVSA